VIDINGGEFVVLVVLAALLIGPERLPGYAAQLAALVRRGKAFVQDARSRVDTELGSEFKDVDWSKLDPRQYDPRRIVREALLDDDEPVEPGVARRPVSGTTSPAAATRFVAHAGPAPFDDEAT
jgi:sec-independent protein translocase protein TatB